MKQVTREEFIVFLREKEHRNKIVDLDDSCNCPMAEYADAHGDNRKAGIIGIGDQHRTLDWSFSDLNDVFIHAKAEKTTFAELADKLEERWKEEKE